MRFIIVGRKQPLPYVHYLSPSGQPTTNAEGAWIARSESDARAEVDYNRKNWPLYQWSIEQLPPRKSLAIAVLHSTPVDY